ncbi:solute carrier family 35 member F1 [Cricetulus griseus]|nr:solute carrier family 35 member F1 [Cricetulus griseus]
MTQGQHDLSITPREMLISVALGQVLSLLVCGIGLTSKYLAEDFHANTPVFQSFLNYILLFLVYTTTLAVRQDSSLFTSLSGSMDCRLYTMSKIHISVLTINCAEGLVLAYGLARSTSLHHQALVVISLLAVAGIKGHLGCFQFLSIMNIAAMNIVQQESLWEDEASFGYMPKIGEDASSALMVQVGEGGMNMDDRHLEGGSDRSDCADQLELLDCFVIPVVILLSWFFLLIRYKAVHFIGIVVCILGMGCMVGADVLVGRHQGAGKENTFNEPDSSTESNISDIFAEYAVLPGENKLVGDLLVLGGATLYGISNVWEESIIRTLSRVEFLGMIGLFGAFFSGIQLAIMEHKELLKVPWDWQIGLLYVGFSACMFGLYSFMPVVIKKTSATSVNLSLLTADLYSLFCGLFLFHYKGLHEFISSLTVNKSPFPQHTYPC